MNLTSYLLDIGCSIKTRNLLYYWTTLFFYLAVEEEHGIGVYEADHAEQQILLEARLLIGVLVELHRLTNVLVLGIIIM